MIISYNHKLVCKPYTGERKPESQIRNGFANVKQKNSVFALEVLADAKINEYIFIKKGSFVHLHEALLYNRQTVTTVLESPEITNESGEKQPFVMIDYADVLFVSEK